MFVSGKVSVTAGACTIRLVEAKNWKTVASFALSSVHESAYVTFACSHPKYYIIFNPTTDFRMTTSENVQIKFNIVPYDNGTTTYIDPIPDDVYPDEQFLNPGLIMTDKIDTIMWNYPTSDFFIKRNHIIERLANIPLTYIGNYVAKSDNPLRSIVTTPENQYPLIMGANSQNVRPIPFNYLYQADPSSTGSIDEPIAPLSYQDTVVANNNLNYILGRGSDTPVVPTEPELRPINDTLNYILGISDQTYSIVFIAVDTLGYLYILNKDFTSQLAVSQFVVSEQLTLGWQCVNPYTEPITVDSSSFIKTRSLLAAHSYYESQVEPVNLIELMQHLPPNCVIYDDSEINGLTTYTDNIIYYPELYKVEYNTYIFKDWSSVVIDNNEHNCVVKIPVRGYQNILCCNKLQEKARGSQTTWYAWNNNVIYIYSPVDTFITVQDFINYAIQVDLYFVLIGNWRELSTQGNVKSVLGQNIITYYYKPATHIGEDNCPHFIPVVDNNYQKYYEDYPYGGEQGYTPTLNGNPPNN